MTTTAKKRRPAKKTAQRAKATRVKKPATKRTAAKKAAAKKYGPRKDYGSPVEGFFAKQPSQLRAILEPLRGLVEEAAPDARASIKWGMPFYTIGNATVCALGAHRSHVNLILSGPAGAFDDPDTLLTGQGKTGRHLKLTAPEQLPRAAVRRWVRAAAALARRRG